MRHIFHPTLCGNNPSFGAFRAFFQLGDGQQAREFKLNFGEDFETMGILLTTNYTNSGAWYDLSGRKIANSKFVNRKLLKGVYIYNGRKMVVK